MLAVLGQGAERRAVGLGWQGARGGEVRADAHHVLGFHLRFLQRLGDTFLEHLQVVEGILERPVRFQLGAAGQALVDDAVGVGNHRRGHQLAIPHPNHHDTAGLGSVVNSQREFLLGHNKDLAFGFPDSAEPQDVWPAGFGQKWPGRSQRWAEHHLREPDGAQGGKTSGPRAGLSRAHSPPDALLPRSPGNCGQSSLPRARMRPANVACCPHAAVLESTLHF